MAVSWRDSLAGGAHWFNERPIRERALIAVTALVLIVVVGWELAVSPALQSRAQFENRLATLAETRDSLLAQQDQLNNQLSEDPSRALKSQLEARQQRLARLDQQIAETTGQLVAPRAMVSLLREMLTAQKSLTLTALELKAPTPVFETVPEAPAAAEKARTSEPLLYAHDVELRVQGSYLEVLAYLEHLEALDERLGWVLLEYDAENWPAGEAVIQVRTLSLEPAWLGV